MSKERTRGGNAPLALEFLSCRMSIVTTCRNQLAHLRQSLPLMLRQSASEVIVVDQGGPDQAADWVARAHPAVRVVRLADDGEGANLARARNAGAAAAAADILCFVDPHVLMQGNLGSWIDAARGAASYFLAPSGAPEEARLSGFVVCSKRHFREAGGFDEAIRGWGGEDADFHERLDEAGVIRRRIPSGMLAPIPLAAAPPRPEEPAAGPRLSSRQALVLNRVYRLAKRDAGTVLKRQLSLAERQLIHRQVNAAYSLALKRRKSSLEVEIGIPALVDGRICRTIGRRLSYRAPVLPQGEWAAHLWLTARRLSRSLRNLLSERAVRKQS